MLESPTGPGARASRAGAVRPASGAAAGPWSLRSSVLCLLLTVVCSLASDVEPALAHTSLVSSDPAPGAVVVGPAAGVVTLEFSRPVSPRRVQVAVTGPDGADVGDGPARTAGAAVSRSVAAWPTSGTYRLAYRVLAEDGHPLTGQVPFQVTLPAAGASPATPAMTTLPGASAQAPAGASPVGVGPVLVAVLSGVAVLLVAGGVRAARRSGGGR